MMICLFLLINAVAVSCVGFTSVYHVTISTSSDFWAGTNANVKLRMYGTKGTSGIYTFTYQRSYFESGSTDKFRIGYRKDLGQIKKISIGHDNSATFGNAWKLKEVRVQKEGTPLESVFKVDKWLDSDKGTYVTVETQDKDNCGVTVQPRVVNGVTATPNQWPWQVQIRIVGGIHHCGATLIHPEYVLTASHCVQSISNPSSYLLTLGQHDLKTDDGTEQNFTGAEIIMHPDYNSKSFDNDIALIKLNRPAMLNSAVKLACLPNQGEILPGGKKCYITGWGRLYGGGPIPDKLQQAVLPSVSNTECHSKMKDVNRNGGITNNMVCAGGNKKSGCHGDSGGPYVCANNAGRFVLHGAVSWGNPFCSMNYYYTVFARVGRYVDWISSKVYFKYVNESQM